MGQAAFGSVDPPTCAFNEATLVHTSWPLNTDMLVRRHFTAPAGTTSLHLDGTVDNNADIYLNGMLIAHVDSGNCVTGAIDVDIPASDLTSDNVLAIRGTDLGVADYLDVQLTATGESTTTVISNSYASVEYIENFSVSGCINDLIQHSVGGIFKATALCGALRDSANSAPPSQLNAQTIGRFESSKEYRGFMMVPSFALTCSASGEVLSTSLAGDSPFYASLGFTKAPRKIFSSGESYNPQDPSFDTGALTFITDPDGAVTISYRWASRIATLERKGQYLISGYDAPYVWLTFDEKIGCDGQQKARFDYTNFPATDLYINGVEVSHSKETNSFAHFIKQGGKVLNPPGYGNLAFPCVVKQFDNGNSQPVFSYDACQDNQLPAGAGAGGGGSL
jgi:hypothetical protein